MSFKPEVQTAGNGDKWTGNALRFATLEEAQSNVQALMARWFLVTGIRVVECEDPVNYRWDDNVGLIPVEVVPENPET